MEMSKVMGYNIQKNPEMFILGLNMETINVTDRTLVWYMITATAICTILETRRYLKLTNGYRRFYN